MSKQQSHRLIAALIATLAVLSSQVRAADLGTAFTYQGSLEKPAGSPVTNTCDFEFTLWDDADPGAPDNQLGPTLTFAGLDTVAVTAGVFTVALDFGANAINGEARWLGIKVCCPSGCTLESLDPRVELTPAPYALAVPGLRIDQTSGSPNVLGGFSGNSATAGVEGATIAGGGAAFESTDGRWSGDPQILCALNADCGGAGTCVPNGSVGRCDDDAALCDSTHACATGVCVLPPAPNQALANYVSIGGGYGNVAGGALSPGGVATGAKGPTSTVGGGFLNTASGIGSTVGGGVSNTASGGWATVCGGTQNTASKNFAIVGGGQSNRASGDASTVVGGGSNTASGNVSTVSGGGNMTSGDYATIPGGLFNVAGGRYSFAAGLRAIVRDAATVGDTDGDEGTFVWADTTGGVFGPAFTSTGPNQFLIRASGGVGIGTNAPAARLHVVGPAGTIARFQDSAVGGAVQLQSDGNGQTHILMGSSGSIDGQNNALQMNALAANGLVFKVSNSQKVRILANGNVGIGIDPPTEKLDVAGTAQMTGFKLTTSFGSGLVLTSDASGNGTWQAAGGGSGGWGLTGNSGTTPGTNFLGTTDNKALQLHVNGARALRIEPNATSPNLVGGFSGNTVAPGVVGATVAGGGAPDDGLGPPDNNRVISDYGTVGGGWGNIASNSFAIVGGGQNNTSSGGSSTVGGGALNTASSIQSTVVGGAFNTASGPASTVVGGSSNTASGDYSFAAGLQAKAIHNGAFVWGDSQFSDVSSPGTNTISLRAAGGIWLGTTSSPTIGAGRFIDTSTGAHLTTTGVWTDLSDRDAKENFEPLDARSVLDRLAYVPITRWNFKSQDASVQHIGPVAQDFHAAFSTGEDDKHLAALDTAGVALAAIQGLYQVVQEKECRIDELEGDKSGLEARVAALEAMMTKVLAAHNGGGR